MARIESVRIGIIGVGQIGKCHIETYAAIPGVQVVAAADVNEAELACVAEKHKIPHAYANFREMLQRDDIDAVDVCLHNNFHMPMTVAALEAGKHVYCEKPMAGSYVDAQAMLDTAKRCGRMLSIQIVTLFYPATSSAKQLIDDGRLGHVYHARSTGHRRRGRPFVDGYGAEPFVQKEVAGGGALFDMGVYHIAQILYLLGLPKVRRITGKTYQEIDMDEERRRKSGYNVEELGLGFVTFEGGLTLDIIESWAIHLEAIEGSCIVGSKGGIRLQPFELYTDVQNGHPNSPITLGGGPDDSSHEPQRHWVAALQGKADLLPTAETALCTMLVSEGIYQADRLGREVTADEVVAMSKSTAIKV